MTRWTDDDIRKAFGSQARKSLNEFCKSLGIPANGYYYKLIRADIGRLRLSYKGKRCELRDATRDQIGQAVENSRYKNECLDLLGWSRNGTYSTKILRHKIQLWNIDTSHWDSQFVIKNKYRKPNDEVFVEDSTYSQHLLRKRIIAEDLIRYQCSSCGQLPYWNGKELVLELDHINGRNNDNRLENLRFLCPNCHTQQPTSKARNILFQKNVDAD